MSHVKVNSLSTSTHTYILSIREFLLNFKQFIAWFIHKNKMKCNQIVYNVYLNFFCHVIVYLDFFCVIISWNLVFARKVFEARCSHIHDDWRQHQFETKSHLEISTNISNNKYRTYIYLTFSSQKMKSKFLFGKYSKVLIMLFGQAN